MGPAQERALTPFPFLVGSGRSGTTLLRAMFDAHPEVAVPDEVSFVIRLGRPHNAIRYGRPLRFDRDAFRSLLLTNSSFVRWGLDDGVLREALGTASDFPGAVRRLYRAYAEA